MLPYIEIKLNKVENTRKNKIIRKKKMRESADSPVVEEHGDVFYKNRKPVSYAQPDKEDREVIEGYDELCEIVDTMNYELSENNSGFRYAVDKTNDDVFLSVLRIRDNGERKEINRINITHELLIKWIRNIETEEGLFIDDVE